MKNLTGSKSKQAIHRGVVATAVAALLLFGSSAASHAATSQYFNGNLSMSSVTLSGTMTSNGGTTWVGGSLWTARNSSYEAGYVYSSAAAYQTVTNWHSARANSRNGANWEYPTWVSGSVLVRGWINY